MNGGCRQRRGGGLDIFLKLRESKICDCVVVLPFTIYNPRSQAVHSAISICCGRICI